MNDTLQKLFQNRDWMEKLTACRSEAEMQALLQAAGVQISPEELAAALQAAGGSWAEGELNESELGRVAGGYSNEVHFDFGQGEGELAEVHDMLERMNGLAAQAAAGNGPLPTPEDERAKIEQLLYQQQELLGASRTGAVEVLPVTK